jgi:hypothetical protein
MSPTITAENIESTPASHASPIPRRSRKIWVSALLCLALVAIGFGVRGMGEEVYRGTIDGKDVVYEEGIFCLRACSRFTQNRMTVRDGDTFYTFIDCMAETGIDWRAADLSAPEERELCRVVIDDGHTELAYFRPAVDPTTIEGQHEESVLRRADALFNHLREDIRNELRFGYLAEHVPLEFDMDLGGR